MAAKRDYYEILGVGRNADTDTIKKAYRKLAKKYHPDSNAGNARAEERFKEITEAYRILGDPEKKKLYDQFGHAAFEGGTPRSGGQSGPDTGYREYQFESGDMGDIFGDIFGDLFQGGKKNGGFSGDGFSGRAFRRKGADIQVAVAVSFEEAVFGCDKRIRLQDSDGKVSSVQVHIPAGMDSGKSIRLTGKGMPGTGGGEAGDLLLKIKAGEKPGFERKGMDVQTTAFIPFTTAVFGGEVPVGTLYGTVVCRIAPGTQSGTKIRLKGKGIVSVKNPSVHGDQYVMIQIQVPQNLTPEAKEKLREYAKAGGERTHGGRNGSVA